MTRSRKWLVAALSVAGLAAFLGSVAAWESARSMTLRAAADLDACAALERQISVLRDLPRQAQAAALQQPEMARRIEKAAQQAGIDARNIERIAPEEPRRVGESVYLESPTQIVLAHATLGQLITFLHTLSAGTSGAEVAGGDLRVQAVRLGAPRGGEAGNTWRAEITVSYWVYSPKTSGAVLIVKD